MARGLPVVAAGSGAHLETVGGTPGAFLFRPGDAEDGGRQLAELAGSPDLRDDYGARLQAVQREQFTVDEQARRTQAVYEGVL
jgi:glycosyltransferase involved in cell wall biosynthesis